MSIHDRISQFWRTISETFVHNDPPTNDASTPQDVAQTINPATGLPMIGAVDVAGNPYGSNIVTDHHEAGSGVSTTATSSIDPSPIFDQHWQPLDTSSSGTTFTVPDTATSSFTGNDSFSAFGSAGFD